MNKSENKSATRFVGIDLARFLAVIGMMAAHLLVSVGAPEWVMVATDGFPSTLFAVLGGFGVTFACRRYAKNSWAAFVATFMRGLVVFLIGWVCEALPPSPIALILMYFGMALMCAAFFVALPSWILIIIAAVLALVGPQLLPVFRANLDTVGMLDLTNPITIFRSLFFTGTYPVITWLAYIVVGMILCRLLTRVQGTKNLHTFSQWLTGCGAGVALIAYGISEVSLRTLIAPRMATDLSMDQNQIVEFFHGGQYGAMPQSGWMAALVASPHSGATMDILLTGGVSVAIVGLALLATSWMTSVPIWLQPFTRAGAAPLTVYVSHIVMTSIMYAILLNTNDWAMGQIPWWVQSAFWWQLAIVILIGVALTLLKRRGPLETLTSSISHTFADLVVERQGKIKAALAPESKIEPESESQPDDNLGEGEDKDEAVPAFRPIKPVADQAPAPTKPASSPLPSRRDFHGNALSQEQGRRQDRE